MLLFSKKLSFISGIISGLIFAPIFFVPGLVGFSILCYQVKKAISVKHAMIVGFLFGFGHFLISLYWICIGVSVYIDEFWWALPFALFGLPIILAFFIAASSALSWLMRNNTFYHLVFCLCWLLFEWLRSWLFTGLPWNLLGYSLSFSEILIQLANIVGIYGLSFITIYIATSFYYFLTKETAQLKIAIITSIIILLTMIIYGTIRLQQNPTNFSKVTVRLVQPSIPQISKWNEAKFWQNLNSQIELSLSPNKVESNELSPDLIIWSEAALIVPYTYFPIKQKLMDMLKINQSILITGGVTNNNKQGEELQIYSAFFALSTEGESLFEYHKSHLVPFGEYMPFKNILPIKKLTPGLLDYTEGISKLVHLDKFNLTIRPLVCYESIFPSEVRVSNRQADVIINITNDSWYGNSSGPYQHFHISRMRAVENGLPMLRLANNGISAIIDPLGRVVAQLTLNKVGVIDGKIPSKLSKYQTLYSQLGDITVLIIVISVLILQFIIKFLLKNYTIIHKNT